VTVMKVLRSGVNSDVHYYPTWRIVTAELERSRAT
jgi:hypothetical protein